MFAFFIFTHTHSAGYLFGISVGPVVRLVESLPKASSCHEYLFRFNAKAREAVRTAVGSHQCFRSLTGGSFRSTKQAVPGLSRTIGSGLRGCHLHAQALKKTSRCVGHHLKTASNPFLLCQTVDSKSNKSHASDLTFSMKYRQHKKVLSLTAAPGANLGSHRCWLTRSEWDIPLFTAVACLPRYIHYVALRLLIPKQRPISPGEFLIEYVGETIRPVLTDYRERYYDSKVRGLVRPQST